MVHTTAVLYNAVQEQPENVHAWCRFPGLVDLNGRGLPKWKWREVSAFHEGLKKHSSQTPMYTSFRPNRISPGTRQDFVWLELAENKLATYIGDIDDCPFEAAIWGTKTIFVPLAWARGVSMLFREVNIRELRNSNRVVLIDGTIGYYLHGPIDLSHVA